MNETYLKRFMDSVPNKDYKLIKDRIISECGISKDVWQNWLSGRTKIPLLAKLVINRIAGYDIFSEVSATLTN